MPDSNQHSTLTPASAVAALEDFVDQSRASHEKKLGAARAISVMSRLEEQFEAQREALRQIAEGGWNFGNLRPGLTVMQYAREALNPAKERLGGWCEEHGGYTGLRCSVCDASSPASKRPVKPASWATSRMHRIADEHDPAKERQ